MVSSHVVDGTLLLNFVSGQNNIPTASYRKLNSFLVDEWKIGLRVRGRHRDDKFIHREQISRAIRRLIATE